ncbi:MAG: hypothetical protein IPL24_08145 [Bacteroidetes bacterium]|nr:hypothetical protein [Bacteroidota bacterium]
MIVVAGLAVASKYYKSLITQEYGEHSTRGPAELTADKANLTSGLDRD